MTPAKSRPFLAALLVAVVSEGGYNLHLLFDLRVKVAVLSEQVNQLMKHEGLSYEHTSVYPKPCAFWPACDSLDCAIYVDELSGLRRETDRL